MTEKTFGIIPASNAPFIFLVAVGIFFILLIGFFAYIGYSARNVKYSVSDEGLRIKGGVYGRFIPRDDIFVDGARIIDLNASQEYKPRFRTNGIGLPGYSEGWFKLKNGEKALLFVTNRSNVVYIPTSKGYSVMLSVEDSEGFYESIKLWR